MDEVDGGLTNDFEYEDVLMNGIINDQYDGDGIKRMKELEEKLKGHAYRITTECKCKQRRG